MTSTQGNIARPFAFAFGVAYLLVGLLGFAATGFTHFVGTTGTSVAGLHLNPFHNIVHIAIGLILIAAAAWPDATVTQGTMLGVGIIYVAATLLGFLGKLPIISITSAGNGDNFLHLASALLLIFGGLAGVAQQHESDTAKKHAYYG